MVQFSLKPIFDRTAAGVSGGVRGGSLSMAVAGYVFTSVKGSYHKAITRRRRDKNAKRKFSDFSQDGSLC
jgi:hypothetical protein